MDDIVVDTVEMVKINTVVDVSECVLSFCHFFFFCLFFFLFFFCLFFLLQRVLILTIWTVVPFNAFAGNTREVSSLFRNILHVYERYSISTGINEIKIKNEFL